MDATGSLKEEMSNDCKCSPTENHFQFLKSNTRPGTSATFLPLSSWSRSHFSCRPSCMAAVDYQGNANPVLISGVLLKRSMRLRAWRKRTFILDNHTLSYMKGRRRRCLLYSYSFVFLIV
jgi:hypothetical protein